MRLIDLIKEEMILVDLKCEDKWDCIQRLVDWMVEKGKVESEHRDTVLTALVDREKSMSTGMEHGVAIPHGQVTCVDDIVAVFATSRDGVPFESIDGQPAKLIILLVIPKDRFRKHIQTLAGIARLLNQSDLREELVRAETSKDIMGIISRRESDD
ncbi:MAG: PTS sugar transporter subunit IIA [Planctomycetota bacterium]